MFNVKVVFAVLTLSLIIAGVAAAQTVEDNFNDFVHYTKIGQFDLAKGYALALLAGEPDPVEVLALTEDNPRAYNQLLKVVDKSSDPELVELSSLVLGLIEQGRFIRRSDPKIIVEEIKRLSSTTRGHMAAVKRLQNAGEYAIMYMLDAMADRSRRDELPNILKALPKMGRHSIRPLAAASQTEDNAIRVEIVKAMGKIGYPQSLAYLKYIVENDSSAEIIGIAKQSIAQIDPAALNVSAAQLFFKLGESYYYHAQSLATAEDADFANVWFWDAATRRLTREQVDKAYFNELMTMRSSEWALKADPGFGQAIGLWLAAFCKAESAGVEMPNYFGTAHAGAMVYATTAGPEYLHQALARAIKDKNAYVALCAVEALATTAGEQSLLYRLQLEQPLVRALTFDDRAVRYSSAIAIAAAGPKEMFPEKNIVIENLAETLDRGIVANDIAAGTWDERLADSYALRAANVMLSLAQTRNAVIDLSLARDTLIGATKDDRPQIQVLASRILAYLKSPSAQRAVATMALAENNDMDIRIAAFESLALSAKINASQLDDERIDAIYALVSSTQTDPELRSAAAVAYGALNLPSRKVKDLVLDQSRS